MVAVEQDEKHTDGRWKQQKPILCECVWYEETPPAADTYLD